ncbi:MAG: FKBP-type peptidyl-prolyl cis-trans isomerase [Alistipes sp.]|nr:FKBP-type peptidyl-prolyl cis-trans isomerase [Alistipes sp.]
MKGKGLISTIIVGLVALVIVACGGPSRSGKLQDSADSLSYIIGMNIAYNIMEMDSTLKASQIMAGISDVMAGEPKISLEDGKFYLLSYMNYDVYDRVKKYENQYLEDLANSDKNIVRTRTGLTYRVNELGDMGNTASHPRDTVAIMYTAKTLAGAEVDALDNRPDTLRTTLTKLIDGLEEGVKLVGQGGKITLWMPSTLAYGAQGDEQKNIKPNEMLEYEVEIIEVKRRRR